MFAKSLKSLVATATVAAGGAAADDGPPITLRPTNEPMAGLKFPEAQKVDGLVAGLISELGSPQFRVREAARSQLHVIGLTAGQEFFGQLYTAVKSPNPEVCRSADNVLGTVVKQRLVEQHELTIAENGSCTGSLWRFKEDNPDIFVLQVSASSTNLKYLLRQEGVVFERNQTLYTSHTKVGNSQEFRSPWSSDYPSDKGLVREKNVKGRVRYDEGFAMDFERASSNPVNQRKVIEKVLARGDKFDLHVVGGTSDGMVVLIGGPTLLDEPRVQAVTNAISIRSAPDLSNLKYDDILFRQVGNNTMRLLKALPSRQNFEILFRRYSGPPVT